MNLTVPSDLVPMTDDPVGEKWLEENDFRAKDERETDENGVDLDLPEDSDLEAKPETANDLPDDDLKIREEEYRSNEISAWLKSFAKYKVLKDREDFDPIYWEWKKTGSEEAFLKLVYGNARLAVKVALYYRGRGLSLADMMQEGMVGIAKALRLYDPHRGCKFSTYANWWIRQRITRAIEDSSTGTPYRIPNVVQAQQKKIKKATAQYIGTNGRFPTDDELLAYLKEKGAGLNFSALNALNRTTIISYGGSLIRDGEEGMPLSEILPAGESSNPEAWVSAEQELALKLQACNQAWDTAASKLKPGKFEVLGQRIRDNKTLREIAEERGHSRERIRQVQEEGTRELSKALGISFRELQTLLRFGNSPEKLKRQKLKSASAAEIFKILRQHAIQDGSGRILIKSPVNTLRARTTLSDEEIERALGELVASGKVESQDIRDCLLVKEDIQLPEFSSYKSSSKRDRKDLTM